MDDNNSTKIDPVHLNVDRLVLDAIKHGILELKDKISVLEKKISITPAVFSLFLKLKLNKLNDKLQVQEMLYAEWKKQHDL